MKITSIETFHRDSMYALVRVRTDDGAEGWGQTSAHGADLAVQVLHSAVAPHFLGEDPWDWGAAVDRFTRRTHKFVGTYLWRALCGIDTAVYDLLGKTVQRPVYQLLGGAVRTRIPVYGSSMSREIGVDEEIDRFLQARDERGFRAFKLRVAEMMGRNSDPWPGRSRDLVRAARERLGPDVTLHADANGGYSASEAIRMGRHLEAYDFGHFEEPCPWNDLESTAEVARALDIAVAGGEQDFVLEQFHRMITKRVVDIVQPDIGYVGGMLRAVKVCQMAENAGLVVTPHNANQSLSALFHLHLAASQPAVSSFLEWSIEDEPWSRDLYSPLPQVIDGAVQLSAAPGWGVDISMDFLRAAATNMTSSA